MEEVRLDKIQELDHRLPRLPDELPVITRGRRIVLGVALFAKDAALLLVFHLLAVFDVDVQLDLVLVIGRGDDRAFSVLGSVCEGACQALVYPLPNGDVYCSIPRLHDRGREGNGHAAETVGEKK